LKLANDYGVAFDVALTSNLKTGVITDLVNHPLRTLLAHGCEVSLGTDDPVIYNTTMEKEFRIAKNIVGVTDQQIEFMKQTAIRRAFERPHLTK
jgi:adenosine deaminase